MSFNKEKCKVLHLGRNNVGHAYRLGDSWLRTSTSEKYLDVVIDNKLNISQQCESAAKKANSVLDCIQKSIATKTWGIIFLFYSLLVRLKRVQKRAIKMIQGLEGLSCEDMLKELGLFNLEKRRLRGDMIVLFRNEKTQKNKSWKALFMDMYSDFGRYIQYYATLKKAWDDLEKYLAQRCPRMISSLKDSVQEEELDAVEAQIGCKLPDDYRCSFRIHNGQKLVVPGLMGSMALSNHYRSEDLLDIDTAAGGFQQRLGLKQCLPLTFCIHTGLSQYMALESVEGRSCYEIFYQCPDQMARNPSAIDMFITGSSYLEWFTSYVNNVVTGGYPIIRDQIFRYIHDKDCVARTGDITVSVSTSFLPELSSIHPPHYFFTYRIRIEMSKDALPEKACQLDSRYWRITNAKGDVEEVQGPGVVGEFPIISPGRVYEYTSCTTFATTSGYMEGYYTFHCLYYKDKFFNVAIPRFHMVCPTFKISTARMETNHVLCAKDEDEDSTDTDEYEDRHRILDMPAPSGHCPCKPDQTF